MEPAWLEHLVLALPDAVVVADEHGTIVWGNPAAERIFGLTNHDVVGRNALELVHPEDHNLVLTSLKSVLGKNVGTPIELRVKASTGWKLVELIGANLVGASPIDGLVLCVRDLTERRRWEVATNDIERFRSLVHNSASILLLLDRTGTVESVSAAITRILGHDQELVEGQPLDDLVVPADRSALGRAGLGFRRRAGGGSDHHRGGLEAQRWWRACSLRVEHRQPARRSDGQRAGGVCPQHQPAPLDSRSARAVGHP